MSFAKKTKQQQTKKNSDKDTLRPTILPVKSFSLASVESELWADTLLPSVPYQNA